MVAVGGRFFVPHIDFAVHALSDGLAAVELFKKDGGIAESTGGSEGLLVEGGAGGQQKGGEEDEWRAHGVRGRVTHWDEIGE